MVSVFSNYFNTLTITNQVTMELHTIKLLQVGRTELSELHVSSPHYLNGNPHIDEEFGLKIPHLSLADSRYMGISQCKCFIKGT